MLFRRLMTCLPLFALVFSACQKQQETGETGAYVENGVLWAFGSVELAQLPTPGAVMISRKTAVQGVNTQQVAGYTYEFYGAALATTGDAGRYDLAYVDLHPTQDKALAYAYELNYQPRACSGDLVDVFAILKVPGRSYDGHQSVWLGTVNFQNGSTLAAMTLATGLRLSEIADGVFKGQWALHYPNFQTVVLHPWEGLCPKSIAAIPGQLPSQNPGQFDACRPLPPANDLCDGDPTKAGCSPLPPVQQMPVQQTGTTTPTTIPGPMTQEPAKTVSNLTEVAANLGVYAMDAATEKAKIVFVSANLAAGDDTTNAQTCSRQFYAVTRTVDRQINTACSVAPAPATAENGKLTCAVTVTFDNPQTFLERTCNVTATFRGAASGDEVQHIQVLKK